ncbi:radical SAM superfamily enzyme YgiQ (UPF0313 family) [Kibdelosporangium banguiense]|uniref:Radical SAM superfamily enzyme YgiQ (UPF0313 family) n=1 Tax=Kibdelosporangium banguiense TaxID=1365924 RepID=A0ABS4TFE3_9PSEU|nr:KedN5 family methylcobalamin-dependent radical SAM C-methyltransferase [Kibdelosporangium banguiense]MBP2323137.1 radical SAM superfamily enzyme YgiQ (UPF0313 family) [Kibdelosporangium banguiense]
MTTEDKLSVQILQQGVWDMPMESMPLASGYLKAMALADDYLRTRVDVRIRNFRGGVTLFKMANDVFAEGPPDVMAFSVFGWNFREFGALAETFKQMNPHGLVIFGGTHVANQAERTFRLYPEVDVIVNGEGEEVFVELLKAHLAGTPSSQLGGIEGISFVNSAGEVVTTAERTRLEDLDVIPSPTLTGAIELLDDGGQFRYDVALMETNRGCPYKCSFCYWGGAVGQRVRAFSRERLRAELELFAKLKVHTIVLCDANFGMLPTDAEFVADLLEVRQAFGFPRALETSWAKNKSKVFYEIVRTMKQAGLRSSFTLALQTLDDNTLKQMNRRNMKVNDWEDLAEWLDKEGLDSYAELIWGAPGETIKTFMEGYDRLSRHVSRIAVYPLHLLPNTKYAEQKSEYGIISVRGDTDDFEYILAHDTVSFADNDYMKIFLFWARVVAENAVLRNIWVGIRELGGTTQSTVLRALGDWINETDDPAAIPLRRLLADAIEANSDVAYGEAVSYLFGDPAAKRMLRRWWTEAIEPLLSQQNAPVLAEIFRYDLLTLPVYQHPKAAEHMEPLPVLELAGEEFFVRANVELAHDVPAIVTALRSGTQPDLSGTGITVDLYYRTGAQNVIPSTNHEVVVHYIGMTEAQAREAATNVSDGLDAADDAVAALLAEHGGCS